jgi:hypothetical protein
MLTIQSLEYFYSIGLHAVPVRFNLATKDVDKYPFHETDSTGPDGRPSLDDAKRWFREVKANGVGIKMYPPYGMIDFDIKNATDKKIFDKWMLACSSVDDGWLKKVCIETTRNGGYHVYIKFAGLSNKLPLASENHKEMIAIYTGTVLSFCAPSPGYEFTHNNWEDLDFLTDDEFDLLTAHAGMFNKDKETYDYSTEKKEGGLRYPKQLDHIFSQFDRKLDGENFEILANSIGLYREKNRAPTKKGSILYKRDGTLAPYSAKVFFYDRYISWSGWRVVIFSASMHNYPCFHDRSAVNDPTWILTPGRLLYYKNERNWERALAELQVIIDSVGMLIDAPQDFSQEDNVPPPEPRQSTPEDRFPFEVFSPTLSENFHQLAAHYSIPLDYLGTTALYTIAGLSGNMYQTELNGAIKNIIYAMLVGPSGVGKSPAYNLLCGDIIEADERELYKYWQKLVMQWEELKEQARVAKAAFTKPKPPRLVRTMHGGTMEGIMAKALNSPAGIALYYDEGGKMFGSPNAFKPGKDNGSANDFWNEMWNGKPSNEARADETRERFVPATSISSLIGMQTDRVTKYFDKDSIDSGLANRFILTMSDYIDLNENVDHFSARRLVCEEWREKVRYLFNKGAYKCFKDDKPQVIQFTENAGYLYNELSKKLIKEANIKRAARLTGDVSSMMVAYDTKLYAYVGRFIMILAILESPSDPIIRPIHVENAEKLYRFYRKQADNLFAILHTEVVERMSENQLNLLKSLDDTFTAAQAVEKCKAMKLSDRFFDTAYHRVYSKMGLVKKIKRGEYEKT